MNYERLLAGTFAGVGSLYMIYEGIRNAEPYLVTTGATILSGMMAFFIGEKNGERRATK